MASAAVQNKTPRKVLKKSTRDSLIAYSFIAPNFIGFCVFTLVPMVFAIALAFCAWDGRHAIEFVGLKNFVKLFTTDKIFQAALKNTIVYVIGTVPLTLACSLAMAVLLNQNVKLRNFFRTVAFFPYVASLVAVAAVLAHHSAPAAAYHLLCGHHAHHLRLQGLRPDVHDHAGRPRYCYHDAGVLHL